MTLLSPAFRALRNEWRLTTRRDWFRHGVLFAFVLSLTLLGAIGIHVVLRYVNDLGPFGPLLLGKILSVFYLFLIIILLFSNLITALSTFYLAQDLNLLLTLPISRPRFYRARFLESFYAASWMIGIFSLYVLFDLGVIVKAKPLYFLVAPVTVFVLMLMPAQIAAIFAFIMVSIFPARSTRDFLFFVAVIFSIGLYLFFRFLRPEQWINPDQFAGVLEYFAALRTPDSVFLPSHWAYALTRAFWPHGGTFDILWFLLLVTTVVALHEIGILLFQWLYVEGYSKTQEARQRTFLIRNHWVDKFLLRWLYVRPKGVYRALLLKDLRLFRRDALRSSQLLMILALAIVYVYNFRVIDLRAVPIARDKLQFWISMMNLGTAAFVLAALGARFLFPAVSLEGRAFWILKSAPIATSQILWTKFLFGLPWSLALGVILLQLTNFFLELPLSLHLLTLATLIPMTLTITALAIAMGAIYPVFTFDNIAKVTTGFGAILYMIMAVGFIFLLLGIIFIAARFFPLIVLITTVVLTYVLCGWSAIFIMRRGIRHLEGME